MPNKEPALIDTHTHLYFEQYDSDREKVIARAIGSEVLAMVTIGIDSASSQASIDIAERHGNVFASVGYHPHDAAKMTDQDFEELTEMLNHPKVVAIGEVGLDYHYDYSPRDVQRKVFRRFLDLSLETGKPLIIHTREANEDILDIIRNRSRTGWRGVFHCFAGDEKMAGEVIDMGFHLSFTGNVTFKKSRSLPVAVSVPVEKLMVETDCPFMAPVPHRGKRNEPAFVHYVAQYIAEQKNMAFQEFAVQTTQNAIALFGLSIGEES